MVIEQFLCGKDNYGVLLHDPSEDITVSIDAPDFVTIDKHLIQNNWKLNAIFLTHCHEDHIAGVTKLSEKYAITIYASFLEQGSLSFIHKTLGNNDSYFMGNTQIIALETPGHTPGSLSYYLPREKIAFVGDTLFTLGCGRVNEVAYPSMLDSLKKLRNLNDDTMIYCGHDYGKINCKFALALDPTNILLQEKQKEIEAFTLKNKMLPPTILAQEKKLNPFLRWDDPIIRKRLHLNQTGDLEIFSTLRKMRDHFKG